MSGLKQVTKNVSFNWIGMAVGLVLGFIQAPIVIKGLGNTWFGIWILVNQVVSYTWIFDFGIREAVVRYVSKHHSRKEFDEINEIVSSAIYLYLLISFLTVVFVSLLALLLPHLFKIDQVAVGTARVVMFVVGLNIAINWFFNAYVGILMGLQRFDIFQKIGIGLRLVSFVLIVTFIKAGYGVIALSLIGFGMSMVSNFLVYRQSRRLLPELKLLRFDRKKIRFRPLINYGKYVIINNIGAKIVFATDALIIGMFLRASAITFYAIPGTLIDMLRNVVTSATWVLNPMFSEIESKNETERFKSLLAKATKYSLLAGFPIGIVYLFMGENFISLWMGKEYGEGSSLVLIVLTVATLFTLFHNTVHSALFGISRHNIIAYLRIGEAIGKILLCVIFVKMMGIVGVALGNAISHILFMGIILPIVVCKNLGFSTSAYVRHSILPPFLSSIPFAVCCYLSNALFPARNLAEFFLRIAAILPVFIINAWLISFSRAEKEEYIQMIYRRAPWLRVFRRQKTC